jgi:hypothetical protein
MDELLPPECEFIGMDSDGAAIAQATQRAKSWSRRSSFIEFDLNAQLRDLPQADLTMLFNVSCYVDDLDEMFGCLARRPGHLAVRQYDGAALRFGPMDPEDRVFIEESHRQAVKGRCEFRHYDLDRLYTAIERAPFTQRDVSFELFARRSPFPEDCLEYLVGTMWWMFNYLSEEATERLGSWWSDRQQDPTLPTYFTEVDLCAILA